PPDAPGPPDAPEMVGVGRPGGARTAHSPGPNPGPAPAPACPPAVSVISVMSAQPGARRAAPPAPTLRLPAARGRRASEPIEATGAPVASATARATSTGPVRARQTRSRA